MRTSITKYIIAFLLVVSVAVVSQAEDSIEVIQLKGRTAEEMIPIIRPLMKQNEALSGRGYSLIIRASQDTLQSIRQIIAQLDRPPKRLMISVRRGNSNSVKRNEFSASGTIKSGNAEIRLNDRQRYEGQAKLRIIENQRENDNNSIQRINSIEGRQSFIQSGTLVPTGQRQTDRFGNVTDSVQYRNASTGFYVLPRVNDNKVTLEISTNSVSINQRGQQSFNTQQAQTSLTGEVGKWMAIGGISQQSSTKRNGILYSTKRSAQQDSQIYIKVDVIK